MKKKKTLAATSPTEASRVMAGASRTITPHADSAIPPEALKYFDRVIDEFPKADWTDHQIDIAGLIACMMLQFKEEYALLRKEGCVLKTTAGAVYVNPRKAVVQMCGATMLSLRKTLALDSRAGARVADIAKKRNLSKELQADMESVARNSLISRPH